MVARSLQSVSVSPNHVKKLSWATGASRLTSFLHHAYTRLSQIKSYNDLIFSNIHIGKIIKILLGMLSDAKLYFSPKNLKFAKQKFLKGIKIDFSHKKSKKFKLFRLVTFKCLLEGIPLNFLRSIWWHPVGRQLNGCPDDFQT